MKNIKLFEIGLALMTSSAIIHYLYLIRGDYPFLFIATLLIVAQIYMVISLLISRKET